MHDAEYLWLEIKNLATSQGTFFWVTKRRYFNFFGKFIFFYETKPITIPKIFCKCVRRHWDTINGIFQMNSWNCHKMLLCQLFKVLWNRDPNNPVARWFFAINLDLKSYLNTVVARYSVFGRKEGSLAFYIVWHD